MTLFLLLVAIISCRMYIILKFQWFTHFHHLRLTWASVNPISTINLNISSWEQTAFLVWMYARILMFGKIANGHMTHTHGNTRPMNVFTQTHPITGHKNALYKRKLHFIKGWKDGKCQNHATGFKLGHSLLTSEWHAWRNLGSLDKHKL